MPDTDVLHEQPGHNGKQFLNAASEQPARLKTVGIGASAGGLQALTALFDALPPDTGMVFIVIVHLDPEHKSELSALLQAHTAMPVEQITGKVHMEPDHVYVIPPDKQVNATASELWLTDFEEPRGQRMPIDFFFRSLAENHGDGFAVVLSGGGTDGTVGIKAIKENGGFLMAQDPSEAEYDSMPRSAIATGLVDLVQSVQGIARHLADFAKSPHLLKERPEDFSADEAAVLQKIFTHIQSRTGHDFSQYKQTTVVRRIARRMHVNKTADLPSYLAFLRENAEEAQALFKDLLIGVTTFFRDPESWQALQASAIRKLFQRAGEGASVRAWVAGCSTGEEAYSLAIVLMEHAATLETAPPFQVFASDLDEGALATAREGLYPDAIAADVSEERLERFFNREGSYYRIKREVRDLVLFASHSLLRDPPFSRLDLITCRNLLIYLQRELQEQVFQIFHYALSPEGYLFLGGAETADGSSLFRTVDKSHRIFQARARSGDQPHLPALPLAFGVPERKRRSYIPVRQAAPASEEALHRQALEVYAPPSLLVDENHTVVHLSETAGRYLIHPGGALTADAVRLVRPELRLELHNALYAAVEKGRATVSRAVPVQFNGTPHLVYVAVRPVVLSKSSEPLYLIVFLEDELGTSGPLPEPAEAAPEDAAVRRLQRELDLTREQLQAKVEQFETSTEELRAANEELQSINEEYRSTTEELETSKEELQSINEELQTVNYELKNKLDEVSRAHSDLQNFVRATEIGTLFLDRDLRIKRYTPPLGDIFNLVPSDLGRPISHLTHSLDYNQIEEDAAYVLSNLAPVEREIRTTDEHWFVMRMRPYRTMEDKIDGVVITFIDLTQRKLGEEALRKSEERYRILLENVREYAIFVMDTDRRITIWNTGAERIFGYSEQEALGLSGDIAFVEEDRAAGAPEKEAAIAARDGQAQNERQHLRKDGSRFWGSGIMTALYDPNGTLSGFAKVMRDNTERKMAEDALRKSNETLEHRVQERTRQLRALASTLTLAEQQERRRISQILHDDLQQFLYGIQLKMTFIRREAAGQEKLIQYADEANQWLNEAVVVTRRLTVDLSPPVLKGEGLADSLQWLVSQMNELHNLKVELKANDPVSVPSDDMRVLLFQIIRELLFNVVKHSGTDRAALELESRDGEVTIRVHDDGKGFDPSAVGGPEPEGGFGLYSVRERLDLFNGRLEIQSAPNDGTHITIHVPLS
jgi:two-component system, chemotaxis family, CheB/CheR fusion protein